MNTIILPINPEHVKKMFYAHKIFEFRKSKPSKKIDKILIYETAPTMKIVGECDVEDVWINTPNNIWNETYFYRNLICYGINFTGIEKKFFDKYFKNKDIAIAYKLTNITKYDVPRDLSEYGINYVVQNYVYVDKIIETKGKRMDYYITIANRDGTNHDGDEDEDDD